MEILKNIQFELEDFYQAPTGLDIRDFIQEKENFSPKGTLVVKTDEDNIELAVLFDRDILSAWNSRAENASVCFEELSHFVYLSHNHLRKRNVTLLEMEIQSEIDRVLLAFHSQFALSESDSNLILKKMYESSYQEPRYEESRQIACQFIKHLCGGNPKAWTQQEFQRLRRFFHSDLSEKIHLSREKFKG